MPLSAKQRRHLRALGHHLEPVVHVGKDGITPGLITALDQALETHELVKVRIGQNAVVETAGAATQMAVESGSEVAQVLGSTILLFRAHPEEPKILKKTK